MSHSDTSKSSNIKSVVRVDLQTLLRETPWFLWKIYQNRQQAYLYKLIPSMFWIMQIKLQSSGQILHKF